MLKRAVCTVITKSYLAHARALANSLFEHNAGVTLYVLLADSVDGYFDPSNEPFELICLDSLADQDTVQAMSFYYTAFELCCALRGLLHEYMYEVVKAEKWLFLDSDIMVFSSLDCIFQQLDKSSILLSPHCKKPVDLEYADPYEINLLNSGLYNAGFIGLHRDNNAKQFMDWFKGRLSLYGFADLHYGFTRGLFVDQKWLSLVPLYFANTGLLTEPGANLGHWNLYEHELTVDSPNHFLVDGCPLLFVHFSGLDFNNRGKISTHSKMYDAKDVPAWEMLADIYYNNLLECGYREAVNYPYSFSKFNSGEVIDRNSRKIYYENINSEHFAEVSTFARSNAFFKNTVSTDNNFADSFRNRFITKWRSYKSRLVNSIGL